MFWLLQISGTWWCRLGAGPGLGWAVGLEASVTTSRENTDTTAKVASPFQCSSSLHGETTNDLGCVKLLHVDEERREPDGPPSEHFTQQAG